MGEFSPIHWLIVLAVILLLFGRFLNSREDLARAFATSKKGCLGHRTPRHLLRSRLLRQRINRQKRKRRNGRELNFFCAKLREIGRPMWPPVLFARATCSATAKCVERDKEKPH